LIVSGKLIFLINIMFRSVSLHCPPLQAWEGVFFYPSPALPYKHGWGPFFIPPLPSLASMGGGLFLSLPCPPLQAWEGDLLLIILKTS